MDQPLTAARRLAHWLLALLVRLAPASSRTWAAAMLRELDFVEGDWAALLWALGSASAIFKHAGLGALARSMQSSFKGREKMGKKIGFLAAGAAGAVFLSAGAFGLLYLAAITFPQLGLEHSELTHWLVVIVLPFVVCAAAVIWLWRSRRPMALGILLSVALISTHLAVHFAHHFHAR